MNVRASPDPFSDRARGKLSRQCVPPFHVFFLCLAFPFAVSCGITRAATKSGMKPILSSVTGQFIAEPDLVTAENSLVATLKIVEGIAETFPEDRELLVMAAMTRASYAFAFLRDAIEALDFAQPGETVRRRPLVVRAKQSYGAARQYAERALRIGGRFLSDEDSRALEQLSLDEFSERLTRTEHEDTEALYWLAMSWLGAIELELDPSEASQIPKLERASERILALDERVFYGLGAHLLAGMLAGFRAPALGGQPELAARHFEKARQQSGGLLLPDVFLAQFIYAQTERQDEFEQVLERVIAAEPKPALALFDMIAKRKACRLLAHRERHFLTEPRSPPEACTAIPAQRL